MVPQFVHRKAHFEKIRTTENFEFPQRTRGLLDLLTVAKLLFTVRVLIIGRHKQFQFLFLRYRESIICHQAVSDSTVDKNRIPEVQERNNNSLYNIRSGRSTVASLSCRRSRSHRRNEKGQLKTLSPRVQKRSYRSKFRSSGLQLLASFQRRTYP